MRPRRLRLRLTVWLIRRAIAALDRVADVCDRIDDRWLARRYPQLSRCYPMAKNTTKP